VIDISEYRDSLQHMKKSAKIWKIEKFKPLFAEGMSWDYAHREPVLVERQFVYDSELDCLLDIVKEPDNIELKVYRHQTKTETCDDLPSEIEYALILMGCARWASESVAYTRDYIDKLNPKDYKFFLEEDPYTKIYDTTVYHWVEAFLQ